MFQEQALINEIGKLRRFALGLTKNTQNADDLFQSTILRALEKKDYFLDGTNLFSWTSKMMFNLFVSGYRHRKKFETRYDPAPYIDKVSVGPAQEGCADLHIVMDYIHRLCPEHQEVLQLVCVDGLSYEEAAQALSIPVGTVRSRLSRAREHLQAALDEGKFRIFTYH